MDNLKNFINNHFKLPEEATTLFVDLIDYSVLEPLEILTKENSYPTDFFIITSGIVRAYRINQNGSESTRSFFTTGDITGANSAMIRKAPSRTNYQALTKVTGYIGNFQKLKELISKNHSLSLFYIKILEDAFLKTEKIILDTSNLSSTERYLKLKRKIPKIDELITQYHIASYLNITPVQLSQIRKSLHY